MFSQWAYVTFDTGYGASGERAIKTSIKAVAVVKTANTRAIVLWANDAIKGIFQPGDIGVYGQDGKTTGADVHSV